MLAVLYEELTLRQKFGSSYEESKHRAEMDSPSAALRSIRRATDLFVERRYTSSGPIHGSLGQVLKTENPRI